MERGRCTCIPPLTRECRCGTHGFVTCLHYMYAFSHFPRVVDQSFDVSNQHLNASDHSPTMATAMPAQFWVIYEWMPPLIFYSELICFVGAFPSFLVIFGCLLDRCLDQRRHPMFWKASRRPSNSASPLRRRRSRDRVIYRATLEVHRILTFQDKERNERVAVTPIHTLPPSILTSASSRHPPSPSPIKTNEVRHLFEHRRTRRCPSGRISSCRISRRGRWSHQPPPSRGRKWQGQRPGQWQRQARSRRR